VASRRSEEEKKAAAKEEPLKELSEKLEEAAVAKG